MQDQPSEGLFTEGCFALVEGDYTEEETMIVIAIGHPPCESRESAKWVAMDIPLLDFWQIRTRGKFSVILIS